MFGCIRRRLIQYRVDINAETTFYARYLQTASSNFINQQSSVVSYDFTNQESSTVSYLVSSCGLSLDKATSVSKRIDIKSTENADSVLKLLRTHGFGEKEIQNVVGKYPRIILCKAEKTLKPKIEYFTSLGISGPDLSRVFCNNPSFLFSALETKIIPCLDLFKEYAGSNENLVHVLKRMFRSIKCNTEKIMASNINSLLAIGVPKPHIMRLFMLRPQILSMRVDSFNELVNKIKEYDFDLKGKTVLYALGAVSMNSKENWEKKKKLLMQLGFSDKDFNLAIRMQPILMTTSEKKIKESMEFLVNKVGLKPSYIAKYPNILRLSIQRRIIPRCSVVKLLISEGLIIRKDVNLVSVLKMGSSVFERKNVTEFKKNVPQVLKAYRGEYQF